MLADGLSLTSNAAASLPPLPPPYSEENPLANLSSPPGPPPPYPHTPTTQSRSRRRSRTSFTDRLPKKRVVFYSVCALFLTAFIIVLNLLVNFFDKLSRNESLWDYLTEKRECEEPCDMLSVLIRGINHTSFYLFRLSSRLKILFVKDLRKRFLPRCFGTLISHDTLTRRCISHV
jgi:hypothetical protein